MYLLSCTSGIFDIGVFSKRKELAPRGAFFLKSRPLPTRDKNIYDSDASAASVSLPHKYPSH